MGCDMCGNPSDIYTAIIEDAELSVCENCSKFGKIVGKKEIATPIKKPKLEKISESEKEKIEIVVEDFPGIIKNAREKLGMKQKEFAQKIGEKESIIHKIETGSFIPPLALARKLESLLRVNLIEEHEEIELPKEQSSAEGFTLGDFIKKK